MNLHNCRRKIVDLLNLRRTFSKVLLLHDYNKSAFESMECGVSLKYGDSDVVISLTTYSKRINQVHIVVESLFRQTQQANRIILWLAKEEFSDDTIPLILKKQIDRGLEIKYCEDIKSYKKLLPVLSLTPDSTIITVDDDYIYPLNFVENLLKIHFRYPQSVCYYTGNRISFDSRGTLKPYVKWKEAKELESIPSLLNFSFGAGGVLYPPHTFGSEIFNVEYVKKNIPKADDVWFKAMSLLNNITYVRVPLQESFDDKFVLLEDAQDIALYHDNVEKGENDNQLSKVFEDYKLYDILRKEIK